MVIVLAHRSIHANSLNVEKINTIQHYVTVNKIVNHCNYNTCIIICITKWLEQWLQQRTWYIGDNNSNNYSNTLIVKSYAILIFNSRIFRSSIRKHSATYGITESISPCWLEVTNISCRQKFRCNSTNHVTTVDVYSFLFWYSFVMFVFITLYALTRSGMPGSSEKVSVQWGYMRGVIGVALSSDFWRKNALG